MKDTKKMVQLAVLVAIIVIMAFTPLGFLMVGPVSITFMMIPVAVAAIIVGPAGGAIAGGVFGLSAFLRGFGLSPFATTLMGINPIYTFVLMIIPRVLAGWIPGIIYVSVCRVKNKTVAAMAASLAAPLCNTVLFVSALFLLFGNTDYIMGFGSTAWAIIVTLVGINGLVEAGVGFVTGATISRTLVHFFPGQNADIRIEKRGTA